MEDIIERSVEESMFKLGRLQFMQKSEDKAELMENVLRQALSSAYTARLEEAIKCVPEHADSPQDDTVEFRICREKTLRCISTKLPTTKDN